MMVWKNHVLSYLHQVLVILQGKSLKNILILNLIRIEVGLKLKKIGSNGMMERYVAPSVIPTVFGNAFDSGTSKFIDYKLEHFKTHSKLGE